MAAMQSASDTGMCSCAFHGSLYQVWEKLARENMVTRNYYVEEALVRPGLVEERSGLVRPN